MIGQRIAAARKAAGLSLRATAESLGVSQTTIQKFENGQLTPSSQHLIGLAKTLGVRTEYFFRPFEVELKEVEYRKRKSTPKKLLNKIDGDVRDQAERWLELMNLYPEQPIPKFKLPDCLPDTVSELLEIESLAECLRETWELGLNPIPDLIDTLESRGLNVFLTAVPKEAKFDGLSATIGGSPLIVLSSEWPGDRQRFTLAHELGHLVLSGRLAPDVDEEKACDYFAGAFLMPRKIVIEALGKTRHKFELQELALLKEEFGLSMQGILYRARHCGVIDEKFHRQIFMVFSRRGWRKCEPGEPYDQEKTLLFSQLVFRALGEGYLGDSKAAELLGESISEFHRKRKLGREHAAPCL